MMRKGKKLLAGIVAAAMLFSSLPVSAAEGWTNEAEGFEAEEAKVTDEFLQEGEESGGETTDEVGDTPTETGEIVHKGTSGNVTWSIDDAGFLLIEGSGNIEGDIPWRKYLLSIRSAKITTTEMTTANGLFSECDQIKSIDLTEFDTSKVTDMRSMFSGCTFLEELDLSGLDTSNVTDMGYMFSDCEFLNNLNLTGFDTSNVTNMEFMFSGCGLRNLDISEFDTSSVKTMKMMFNNFGCVNLEVDGFDTSAVMDMSGMFSECFGLKNLNLQSFSTDCVTDMSEMFSGCQNLTALELNNFNTSGVKNMNAMFRGCSELTTLDISGFDTSKVTDMGAMFAACAKLTSLDLSGFSTLNVASMDGMFLWCDCLENLNLSSFDCSGLREGFNLSSCSKLKEINTPKNLSFEIKLPETFSSSENKEYTSLPLKSNESIHLSRVGDPSEAPLEEVIAQARFELGSNAFYSCQYTETTIKELWVDVATFNADMADIFILQDMELSDTVRITGNVFLRARKNYSSEITISMAEGEARSAMFIVEAGGTLRLGDGGGGGEPSDRIVLNGTPITSEQSRVTNVVSVAQGGVFDPGMFMALKGSKGAALSVAGSGSVGGIIEGIDVLKGADFTLTSGSLVEGTQINVLDSSVILNYDPSPYASFVENCNIKLPDYTVGRPVLKIDPDWIYLSDLESIGIVGNTDGNFYRINVNYDDTNTEYLGKLAHDFSKAEVSAVSSWAGEEPVWKVVCNGNTLVKDQDYSVTYQGPNQETDNSFVKGEWKASLKGLRDYYGTTEAVLTLSEKPGSGGGGGGTVTPPTPPTTPIPTPEPTPAPAPDDNITDRPTEENPDVPTTGETDVVKPDENGNVTIDGDTIKDTIEDAKNDADKNGNTDAGIGVVVPVDPDGSDKVDVTIGADALNDLVEAAAKKLEVKAEDMLSAGLNADLLKTLLAESNGADVILNIEKTNIVDAGAAGTAVGKRPVYDVKLGYSQNGTVTWFGSLGVNKIELKFPYVPEETEQHEKLYGIHIADDGTVNWLKICDYNEKKGEISFETTHFSKYAVGYLDLKETPAKAIKKNTKRVTLDWEPAELAEGYTVWYHAEGETKNRRKVFGKGTTEWTQKNLQPGTKYFYTVRPWVKTLDGYVFGDEIRTVRGTTKPEAAKLQTVTVKGGKVTAALAGAAPGAERYAVCWSKTSDFEDFAVGVRTSYTTRSFEAPPKKGTYYVRVKSYRDLGNGKRIYGEWSNSKKIVIKFEKNSGFKQKQSEENGFQTESGFAAEELPEEEELLGAAVSVKLDAAHFPDANFRKYLARFDKNNDKVLSAAECNAVREIRLPYTEFGSGNVIINEVTKVKNIEGIRYFPKLQFLDLYNQPLGSVNLGYNPEIISLGLEYCHLKSVDVRSLKKLQSLSLFGNPLTSLDVTQNPELRNLTVMHTKITKLNVQKNPELEGLNCMNNELTGLDTTNNPKLRSLDCSFNRMKKENLKGSKDLENFKFYPQSPVTSVYNTASGVKMKWEKSEGVVRYKIDKKVYGTPAGTIISVANIKNANTLECIDTGAKSENGTIYQYWIEGYSSKGELLSENKTTWLIRLSTPTLSAPAAKGSGKVALKWNKNSKATGYQIQYSTSSNFANAKTVKVTSKNTVTKTISGLTKAKKYYFRIRSYCTVKEEYPYQGTHYSGWTGAKGVTVK